MKSLLVFFCRRELHLLHRGVDILDVKRREVFLFPSIPCCVFSRSGFISMPSNVHLLSRLFEECFACIVVWPALGCGSRHVLMVL